MSLPEIDHAMTTGDLPLRQVESFEILHILRQDPEQFAVIARIAFKDPSHRLEDLLPTRREVQILERDTEGAYTVFIKARPQDWPRPSRITTVGGYLLSPLEIRDGRVRLTFLGNAKQVRGLIKMFEKAGARYKVVSISDAMFSPTSPLHRLTEKQRRVIIASYRMGYYDMPRKASSKQLAGKLNLGSSTLIAHRRKAERRLLADLIGER